jgi:hypothetical protein
MISKRAVSLVSVFLLLLLFYPFQTTVVPQWRIGVVDDSGNAVKGVGVKQGWRHHSAEIRRHEETFVTDQEGYVTFPRRTVRAGLLIRAVGQMISAVHVHGRSGPYAFVDVIGPYSLGNAEYSPGKPLPTTITVGRLGKADNE